MRYSPAGLFPDFERGCLIMSAPVCRVVVLIGIEVLVGTLSVQPASLAYRSVRAFERRSEGELGSIRSQNSLSFFARVLRKSELDLVALRCPDPCISDSGVARRCVEDGLAWDKGSASLAVEDHVERGSVLDRAA